MPKGNTRRCIRVRIEPQAVEIVPDVVVGVDVGAGTFESIGLLRVRPPGKEARNPARTLRGLGHGCINNFEECGQIAGDLNPAVHPGIAKPGFRVDEEPRERAQVANPHGETRNDAGWRDARPVAQHDTHRGGTNTAEYQGKQPFFNPRGMTGRLHAVPERNVTCLHMRPFQRRAKVRPAAALLRSTFRILYRFVRHSVRQTRSSEKAAIEART